jgi:hypothetical protein
MSQYLLSVIISTDDPAPSDEQMSKIDADIDAFNQEVREAGAWVFAGGLGPVTSATVVDATGSEPVVTDGPYVESKEFLGGFWLIEAADLDVALDWAKRGSAACAAPVEVRPFDMAPA